MSITGQNKGSGADCDVEGDEGKIRSKIILKNETFPANYPSSIMTRNFKDRINELFATLNMSEHLFNQNDVSG